MRMEHHIALALVFIIGKLISLFKALSSQDLYGDAGI